MIYKYSGLSSIRLELSDTTKIMGDLSTSTKERRDPDNGKGAGAVNNIYARDSIVDESENDGGEERLYDEDAQKFFCIITSCNVYTERFKVREPRKRITAIAIDERETLLGERT